ncbi:hypothetical protein PT115_08900 [Erysipelothrix rhusiopathiae]|nr:hypothetical protein [Erysipelothrix rhusiopathiae]
MDLLEKYVLLVDEYRLLTERNVIPKRKNNLKYFEYKELVFKITLLRKFMMKKEQMYIVNILNGIKEIDGMKDNKEIQQLEKEVNDLFNIEVSYSLANSKTQHLYHSITDLLYGLYIHSDPEKTENAILSDERTRKHLLFNFIRTFDPIIYKTYEIIKTKNELDSKIVNDNKKVPIIHYSNKKKVKRKVKLSPKWTNIDGHDIPENEIQQFFNKLNRRDKNILETANLFISLLQEESINYEKISKLLTKLSPIHQHIKENAKELKSINNIAFSNVVRYSTNLKYAYVYFFENVVHPFLLDAPQSMSGVKCIRFKKENITNNYKINNFVNELPSYYMTTTKNQLK